MDLNKLNAMHVTHSAVVVMHELSTDSLILTKRSEHLRHHPGEICFPGGRYEPHDHTLYHTALRELDEELNINSQRITLVKQLAIERTLLGAIIHPWFVTIDTINPFVMNKAEVAEVIHIPMLEARRKNNYKLVTVERAGFKFKSWEFIAHEAGVWGATARIMRQLIA